MASSHFHFNYVLGSVLWFSFFLPLTTRYYIENAYALPYIAVNALCLYAGLGLFFLASWPIYYLIWRRDGGSSGDSAKCFNNYKLGINISLFVSLLGATVKLFSSFKYDDSGIFILFAIGQFILIFGVVTYFLISLMHQKYTTK